MSRIAKNPISIPAGVKVDFNGNQLKATGSLGTDFIAIHPDVKLLLDEENKVISFDWDKSSAKSGAFAGTISALTSNLLKGVSQGFEKRLQLVGVGYRAQAAGSDLNLTLGFSHPVVHKVPATIKVETPTQTEVVIKGVNKQQVGQVAADIRGYRPPEPYKGKGVRYLNETVIIKETKKK
ncbi:MAG: 50S ribosomal protein L6 [Pseudomonadota bacterium]